MFHKFRPLLVATLLFFSFNVFSAEMLVNVFLNARPVQGAQVSVNGVNVGATSESGSIEASVNPGKNKVQISKDLVVISEYEFSVDDDQNVEIAFKFSELSEEPEINFEKYKLDEQGSGAIGILQGVVLDEQQARVANAIITVEDTGESATTNSLGGYILELPRGYYTLLIEHPDYRVNREEDVRVVSNIGVAVTSTLHPRPLNRVQIDAPTMPIIEETKVLGTFVPTETTTDMERMSYAIVDAIDAEQLKRFGDSSVASAIARIAGVTIAEDKYAVVRGLDGRYISSTLNGNLMPTTDPMRRDVQLDLFSANIIGSIEIQKSYTVDMPGDTTGGSVGMNTKDVPDGYTHQLSVGLGYLDGVTGEDIVTYEGSDSDWLTWDDGLRELPAEINETFQAFVGPNVYSPNTCNITGCDITFEENARLAQQFPVIYNVKSESASLPYNFGYALGNVHDLSAGELGYYGSFAYGNKISNRIDAYIADENVSANYSLSKKSAAMNGYFVIGLEDNFDANWVSKTIFLRQSDDATRYETGFNVDDENDYETATLHWVEREFIAQQFSGDKLFAGKHDLKWRLGFSETNMLEPDRRTWTYIGDVFIPTQTERRFSELSENGLDIGLDYGFTFDVTDSASMDFSSGFLFNNRERDWYLARFSFRQGQGGIPDDTSADPEIQLSTSSLQDQHYQLFKSTTNTDSYTAEVETTAFYVNTITHFDNGVSLVAGLRVEDNMQALLYPYSVGPIEDVLDESHTLPAFSLSYDLDDAWKFRGSFSQTVSRPGLIERSRSSSFDSVTYEQIFGNPELVTAEIDNLDLRIEYYFSDGGSASFAWFTKTIDNPIERTVPDASGSAARNSYTFRNSLSADLDGIELDFNKQIYDGNSWAVLIGGNIAYIDSSVDLDEESLRLEGDDAQGRELQGQSPILVNLQVGIDHVPTGQAFTLLINSFDDKMYKVGRGSDFGNEIELGRTSLDLSYEKEFENASKITFRIKNLLDENVEYSQNGNTIEGYSRGTEFTAKYTHNF